MKKFMEIKDFFILENGRRVIIGCYDFLEFKSKTEIKSQVGNEVIIMKPSGSKVRVNVESVNITMSLSNTINVAIELSLESSKDDMPRGSFVFV